MLHKSKFVKSLLFVSSVLITTPSIYANAKRGTNCPDLTRDELRTLCRWKGFSYFPGVSAGTIKFPFNVTLKNTLGACWQKHDIKHYIYSHPKETYPGHVGKYLKKGKSITVCTYFIPGEKQPHSFEATGVALPPPTPPSITPETQEAQNQPRKPKVMGVSPWGQKAVRDAVQENRDLSGKKTSTEAPPRPSSRTPEWPSAKPIDPTMPKQQD